MTAKKTPALLRGLYVACKEQGDEIRARNDNPHTAVSVIARMIRRRLYDRAPALVFYEDDSEPDGFGYLRLEPLGNVVEGPWERRGWPPEIVLTGCHVLDFEQADCVRLMCQPD